MYVGDFPPCVHSFVNSKGIILRQYCGAVSSANTSPVIRTSTNN